MSEQAVSMTLGEISNKVTGLVGLTEKELPAKAAFKLSKIIRALTEEVKEVEQQRLKLAKRYAEKDEEGNPVIREGVYQFTPEDRASFEKEFHELVTTEVSVEAPRLSVDELKDVKVSARELFLLKEFLQED